MVFSVLHRVRPALCLSLVLAGCSANHHTVFRRTSLEGQGKSLVAIDAKQRTIVSSDAKTCAEPSPDVFAVIAQSLSTGGSFSKSANPASVQAALNIAFGSAEQGSTIPRTQTINMLRELMYRTCERGLNGYIGPFEMPIQAVRDQRLMVSVLAIEQLTGVVTPKAIGVGATGAASQSGGEAIIRLDDARKEVEASTAATTKAQADYDKLNVKVDEASEDRVCDVISKAVKEKKELTDDQKKLQQPCSDAGTAMADAKSRQARAQAHEADLRRLSTTLGGSVTTATSFQSVGGDSQDPCCVAEIANAVAEIVKQNFNDSSEFMLFCLKTLDPTGLSDSAKARAMEIQPECTNFLQAAFTAKAKEETLVAARTQLEEAETTSRVVARNNELFNQYWPSLRAQLADSPKRQALASELGEQSGATAQARADCFANADTKEKANACFLALPDSLRRKMVTGESR